VRATGTLNFADIGNRTGDMGENVMEGRLLAAILKSKMAATRFAS
jgi:hypothetical protein